MSRIEYESSNAPQINSFSSSLLPVVASETKITKPVILNNIKNNNYSANNSNNNNNDNNITITTMITTIPTATTTTTTTTVTSTKTIELCLAECIWAVNYPEVQKACFLAKVCTHSPPKYCKFKNIPAILQDGPTCGLTALSMLFNGIPTPYELLQIAKKQNYTENGEMFSAKNLYQLVCDISNNIDKNIMCQLYEGHLNCAKVKDDLKNGACIFVPYDPDFNHGPCLKFGHKAHWALIIGYLIDNNDTFFVISRHGKTRNIAVWQLNALSASNSNLVEFEQPKGYPNMKFLLPDGGIGGEMGLKNQSIIVKGLSIETINIV